jgi:hypothetical protein
MATVAVIFICLTLQEMYELFSKTTAKAFGTLPRREQNMLCKYKGTIAYSVNEYMRTGHTTPMVDHPLFKPLLRARGSEKDALMAEYLKEVEELRDLMLSLLERAPRFKQTTTLYRAVENKRHFLPHVGQYMEVKGFLSCAFEIEKSLEYFNQGDGIDIPVMLILQVAPGIPYIFIDALCWQDIPITDKQSEMVLPPGVRITVLHRRPKKMGRFTVLECTVT